MVTRRKGKQSQKVSGNSNDVWKKSPDTVRQFLEQLPDYEQLCTEVAYILNKKLKEKEVEIATVTKRAKTLKSFLEKIERKKYDKPFKEITDFAGVRVVCLYLSDITIIEELVRSEFNVVEKVDKLNDKGADRFGYGAIHFIVRLGEGTSGARYDDLRSLVCEIQVRTVLQDAWAIIDHHLIYKNESDVPTQLQRKLNSLAGLFETADDQFEHVRIERTMYLSEVKDSQSNPRQFLSNELNKDSFIEYLSWKFPQLETEYYDGQVDIVLDHLDKSKYRKLFDIDSVMERVKGALTKVNKAVDQGESPINYAAPQVLVGLGLADEKIRNALLSHTSLGKIIKQNIVS